MKPALLVIDIQERFFEPEEGAADSLRQALMYVNAAIALFRKKNLPIFCIQHMNEDENLIPGADGFETPGALQILPSDRHIHKTYGNAFNKTPLADELRDLGVDTVILTGFAAEHCVLSTCRGAEDLDLAPIILRGGIASARHESIACVERINDLVSYGALRKLVENCV
jgi:nicotinamidase-related amidase